MLSLLALKVVLWHAYRADEHKALDACVAAYNERQAEVRVEAVAIPYGAYGRKLDSAIPMGNGPDLFIAAHDHLGEQASAGLVQPFESPDPGIFLAPTSELLSFGGRQYGFPLAFKSLVMFRRTDAAPEPIRSTDELEALGRRLRTMGRYALAYETGSFSHQAAWLHGFGGHLLDARGSPQLTEVATVSSVEMVRRWTRERLVPDETSHVVAAELFNRGGAALVMSGPWFLGEISPGVPWTVDPLPVVSTTGMPARPLLIVEGIFLASRSRQAERALSFARWLAGAEAARIRATIGRQPVAVASTWDDPAVGGDPVLSVFRRQLDATEPLSSAPAMQVLWEPAEIAMRQALRGSVSAAEALRRAQRRISQRLAPPPPEVSKVPYVAVLSALALLGAIVAALRLRARAGRVSGAPYALLGPALIATALLVFVPFVVGAGMSLYDHRDGQWRFIGLHNFVTLLSTRELPIGDPLSFYFTLAVTALWTIANVALHLGIGVALALLLRRQGLALRGVYRVLLILPWAIPNYITALIWKGMFHREFGALSALLRALGLEPISWFASFWTAFSANLTTNVWLGFPFMMVVTLGALAKVSPEMEEAARLDGASSWQRFRHVLLPTIASELVPAALLGAIWTFNMFNIVFLVSGGEPDGATDILVSQAYRWAFTRGHRYGYAAAYAVLIFGILLGQTLLTNRLRERRR